MSISHRLLGLCLVFAFIGCSKDESPSTSPDEPNPMMMPPAPDPDPDPDPEPETVSYYKDVKPILDASCVGCHVEGGAGGFDLNGYAAAKPWAMAMAAAVEARTMPPWGAFATDECTPRYTFKNDLSLTDEEIATMAAWAQAGAPEGDPADDMSTPAIAESGLMDWDFEGGAENPVVVEPGQDKFVCVVIDPGLEEETWIKGIEYLPDNKSLVHHIVLFTDPTRASLGKMGEDGTYECFGSAGVPGATAGAWAPGIGPSMLPDDMAMRISAGTLFVMQMHYSPQGGAGELRDQTKLRFKYADAPPKYEVYIQLMGNFDFVFHPGMGLVANPDETTEPDFVIPAGATEHVEINRWTFDGNLPGSGAGGRENLQEVKLMGIAPHMHYAGVKQNVRIDRAAPGETACAPNMLMGMVLCSQANGCDQRDDFMECTKSACPDEYAAMELPCWGCLNTAFRASRASGNLIGELAKCETDVAPTTDIERPAQECLVSAPKYSFEWQRVYEYDTDFDSLPTFTPGTVLTIECTYDNSMNNPLVSGALSRLGHDAPGEVRLGDETLDEMCLVALAFAFERKD